MGKTFIRRALSGVNGIPKKIRVLSRDEAKQHYMRLDYLKSPKTQTEESIYNNFRNLLEFRIGDVRNYSDVVSALPDIDIVVNAAALKQVPACEYFPEQAYLTNCVGANNLIRAIEDNGFDVETLVGVSTDKACKPVNVMGTTKFLQEKIFCAANVNTRKTRYICVRYGNVLASRGSVIPLFHELIKKGGPVTITDERMTRFLLSLEDAVDVVLNAIDRARPGEIFIPIAPTAKMTNVAKALIGDRPIEVKVTGIRPGEKLHESLIAEEEATRSMKSGDYYAIRPMLPELRVPEDDNLVPVIEKEYSSADGTMDLQQTIALLERHNLLIQQNEGHEAHELIT